MNLLQKLKQILINLLDRKPTTISKPIKITKDLERPKIINKISQRVSPNVQIKQVEHKQQQKTITSFTEQIPEPVTEFSPTVIHLSVQHISELKPGSLWILVR